MSSPNKMKRWLSTLLAFASAMMFVSLAGAHAFLDHATPAVGSAVRASPAQVKLWFTQKLEPAFSSVRVLDRSGRQVDNRDPQVDRADATLLRVSLPKLAPGTYRVTWRVLSVDSHVTKGDFTFNVMP
jgi:copper resistance protein C